ncbi:hypothetical protein ACOMHN_007995 [Nucella lapillus]
MTDYEEEQTNEIEALQSIYPEELEILQDSPHHVFMVKVASQDTDDYLTEDNEDTPSRVGCTVQFTYTPTYPDEVPLMEVVSTDSLEDQHVNTVAQFLQDEAERSVGMVMVFTLISALQEKLTKRFEGTRVTIESFMAWKAGFDAERNARKQREKESDLLLKKPSGRELFMTDATLNDSDITFLQEEGDNVEVDESLFENMEDLDLDEDLDDDDDEDDPDYIP